MAVPPVMTMNALNSFVRQKEWAQGEEEKEAGVIRKRGLTGTPDANTPTGPTRTVVSDARNRRNVEGGVRFHSTGGAEGLGISPLFSR